jgi:hypothetical protein
MTVLQPAFENVLLPTTNAHAGALAPEVPFGAIVARQLSVWPFAARTTRLFLLVDPSLPDRSLRRGLLRAMQQAYFASDGYSQTRAVREAALAAHYVLRHHNRDVLPLEHINAATAVAALRADVAFVALAGDAAAFAWRDGEVTGQRGIPRLRRPLGLEQDPSINLWSTPLFAGDRLVLVCGATWRSDSQQTIASILAAAPSAALAEEQLASALSGARAASVLVVGSGSDARQARHLRLVASREPSAPKPSPTSVAASLKAPAVRPRPGPRLRRWLTSLFGVALLASVVVAAVTIAPEPPPQPPDMAAQSLNLGEPIQRVAPSMAVRLGPSGANVVDLAVGRDALYTLDVGESSVRAFALDALDQQPLPSTLVARTGSPIDAGGRRLDVPVAIEYLADAQPDHGVLAIVDQSRTVIQVGKDRNLKIRTVPGSTGWQALGALGSDSAGSLFFLDSGSRRLLEYPPLTQRPSNAPRPVLDATTSPDLAFERTTTVLGAQDSIVLQLDDGTLRRFDSNGVGHTIAPRPADAKPVFARSIASDRVDGVYVADPPNARVLQIDLDGGVLRQLRDPALGGVSQIHTSLDGRRLYALVASGVLVFDIPAE